MILEGYINQNHSFYCNNAIQDMLSWRYTWPLACEHCLGSGKFNLLGTKKLHGVMDMPCQCQIDNKCARCNAAMNIKICSKCKSESACNCLGSNSLPVGTPGVCPICGWNIKLPLERRAMTIYMCSCIGKGEDLPLLPFIVYEDGELAAAKVENGMEIYNWRKKNNLNVDVLEQWLDSFEPVLKVPAAAKINKRYLSKKAKAALSEK
jgi:hypothetical protein